MALGTCELLWTTAYEAGDDDAGDASDVELTADWCGAPGELARALKDSELLDFNEETGRYSIHDLWHHAPDYVQRRMLREAERIKNGKTISDIRREAVSKRRDRNVIQTTKTDLQMDTTEIHLITNDATPSPSPSPKVLITLPEVENSGEAKKIVRRRAEPDPDIKILIDEFCDLYNERTGLILTSGHGQLGQFFKAIKKNYSVEEIKIAIGYYFSLSNPYAEKGTYGAAVFQRAFDSIAQRIQKDGTEK